MPNYEYECTDCTNRFELWQSVGESAPDCPTCGSETKKVFHVPRVIFKGSGFYVTDLRAEKEGKSSKSAKSESNGSTEAKTESPAPAATTTADSSPTNSPTGASNAAGGACSPNCCQLQ